MLVCKFLETVRVKSFFKSIFSDLYQGAYSTVFVTVTSTMAQNDILRFSEDLRRYVRIGTPSLYATHAVVREN